MRQRPNLKKGNSSLLMLMYSFLSGGKAKKGLVSILSLLLFQISSVGTYERRILEINRKRVKVVKPATKTSFPTTEIRGSYAPPFHVSLEDLENSFSCIRYAILILKLKFVYLIHDFVVWIFKCIRWSFSGMINTD